MPLVTHEIFNGQQLYMLSRSKKLARVRWGRKFLKSLNKRKPKAVFVCEFAFVLTVSQTLYQHRPQTASIRFV